MTTNELLEMTMLHTLGMLEEDECAAYEAAFAAASPRVQANIRAEAERMADLGALMPETEPRTELREMVIAAVRAAVHERTNEQRLASERHAAPAVAGVISRAAYAQPKLNRSPRVHRVWRATSIGLAAAVVAMTVVTINLQQTYNHAGSNAFIAKIYDTYGGEFVDDTMFDASTRRVVLASSSESSIMGASVFANPDWDSARLLVKNLRQQPGDEPYRLVVLDAEGNIVREVTTFSSNGSVQSIDIKVNLSTENRLAIYQGMTNDIAETEPLLKSVEADM
ncbi:MAG: hypothetical protein KC996_06430 [Phycisphaerales bacterium]|nr:hypothetical protein [Phycisphaerales bacterium]